MNCLRARSKFNRNTTFCIAIFKCLQQFAEAHLLWCSRLQVEKAVKKASHEIIYCCLHELLVYLHTQEREKNLLVFLVHFGFLCTCLPPEWSVHTTKNSTIFK